MSTHSDLYELIQLSKNKQKNRMDIKNIRESMNSHMKIRILEEVLRFQRQISLEMMWYLF